MVALKIVEYVESLDDERLEKLCEIMDEYGFNVCEAVVMGFEVLEKEKPVRRNGFSKSFFETKSRQTK